MAIVSKVDICFTHAAKYFNEWVVAIYLICKY